MAASVLINTVSLSSGAMTRERHIVQRLTDVERDLEYHVLCTHAVADTLGDPRGVTLHVVNRPDSTAGRLLWENTSLPQAVCRQDPDVLYFPLHITNLVDACPKIAAVRNAAPFYPEAHRGTSVRDRLRLRILRAATRRTIRQSSRVVFMTENTRQRVAQYVPQAHEKGVVIPHGVPTGFEPTDPDPAVLERYDLPDRFVLSVSNVARYKNLVELVEGYAQARSRTDVPPLCLAGKVVDQRYAAAVRTRIRELGLDDAVRLLGFVNHDSLPDLHAAADLFAFSSACENAPVSLVEALACGDAIATSKAAAMPEICGDAAAYFDPYDPTSIGDVIATLWDDPERRATLGQSALERAAAFDWDKAAEQTGTLFAEVAR